MAFNFNDGSGTENKKSGFHNPPMQKKNQSAASKNTLSAENGIKEPFYLPEQNQNFKDSVHFQPMKMKKIIPWNIVIPVVMIALLVLFCYLFRDEITEFLTWVLTWLIFAALIIYIIKQLLFGGRRRR